MRPWLAAWRGGRRSKRCGCAPHSSAPRHAAIEPLEDRRLLSATLAGNFAGTVPTQLTPAKAQRVNVRVKNTGDAPAVSGVTVNLFASSDPVLDANDTLLTGRSRGATLKAGRGATFRLSLCPPTVLPEGDYYLLARIDNGTNSNSAAPAVIASAAPVMVRPPFIDLTGQVIELPRRTVEANGFACDRVKVNVSNSGNVTAGAPIEVRLFASADNVLDANDVAVGVIGAQRLKISPGRARTVSSPVNVPVGTTPGLYYILALVDSAGAVAEVNETNNLAASVAPFQVVAPLLPSGGSGHHHHGGDVIDLGDGYYDDGSAFDGGTYTADEPHADPSSGPTSGPSTEPSDGGGGGGGSDGGGGNSGGGGSDSGGGDSGGGDSGGGDSGGDFDSSGSDF